MLFNSFDFALFLPLVFILYWFFFNRNQKLRNIFLLFVSYLFYGWWDWRFLGLIFLSSLVDFLVGNKIVETATSSRRQLFLWISVVFNLGMLMVFKYYNFFSLSFAEAFESIGIKIDPFTLDIVLPVGISFYTFQTMSYTLDVYREKLKPTRDIVSFFAYVSFFPQLVAGPIERATNLLPQFDEKKEFSYAQTVDGLRLILWGLFKKVVIADNCATVVNSIFDNYESSSGVQLIIGAVFFAFQIYCDFSGYSDIAIGTAKLFGFELMINFRTPYFSRDIAEFWRRWHISLSTWFRDYLYVPLGGSKNGINRAIVNTLVIFIVSGFWHGANWTYVMWGFLNAVYFLPLLISGRNRANLNTVAAGRSFPTVRETYQLLTTFSLTLLAWIFFRSPSISHAFGYIKAIFTNTFIAKTPLGIDSFVPIALVLFLIVEWFSREHGVVQYMRNIKKPFLRYGLYYLLILCIWFFGAFNEIEFIYFQF